MANETGPTSVDKSPVLAKMSAEHKAATPKSEAGKKQEVYLQKNGDPINLVLREGYTQMRSSSEMNMDNRAKALAAEPDKNKPEYKADLESYTRDYKTLESMALASKPTPEDPIKQSQDKMTSLAHLQLFLEKRSGDLDGKTSPEAQALKKGLEERIDRVKKMAAELDKSLVDSGIENNLTAAEIAYAKKQDSDAKRIKRDIESNGRTKPTDNQKTIEADLDTKRKDLVGAQTDVNTKQTSADDFDKSIRDRDDQEKVVKEKEALVVDLPSDVQAKTELAEAQVEFAKRKKTLQDEIDKRGVQDHDEAKEKALRQQELTDAKKAKSDLDERIKYREDDLIIVSGENHEHHLQDKLNSDLAQERADIYNAPQTTTEVKPNIPTAADIESIPPQQLKELQDKITKLEEKLSEEEKTEVAEMKKKGAKWYDIALFILGAAWTLAGPVVTGPLQQSR